MWQALTSYYSHFENYNNFGWLNGYVHPGIWVFYARGSNQWKGVIIFKPGIKLKIRPFSPAFESCFANFLLMHQFASFFHPKQISVILIFQQNQNIWHVSMEVCWNLKKNIINTKYKYYHHRFLNSWNQNIVARVKLLLYHLVGF